MNSPDDRREMLRLFHEFTGFLPFVSHGIEGVKRKILEEACGTLRGGAFSNHVIDTAKMAKLRIPEIRNTSLTSYAKELGIECEAVTEAEEECRLTWKFYQRLERSELERIPELNIRMTLLEELYENDEIGIRVYKSLKRAGIIMLGRFYESWHDGKLRQEARQSMMKVCVYLGRGILEEKIMDGADEETRKGAAGLLFREAARWGYCAPQNEESAELLLMLGEGFLRGEFPVEDGVIFMESDLESAYRAAYYAGECGSPGAKELMEEIERA